MKKELFEKETAITLIALVITIVVLIILAAVAINLSLGNNGIFNRAKTAKEQYQNAQEYEQIETGKVTNQIDSYVGGNRDYTPIDYSTDEQDTGLKWINGKKLYQKTVHGYTPNSSSAVNISLPNAETSFIKDGYIIASSDFYNTSINYYSGPSDFIFVDINKNNNSLYFSHSGGRFANSEFYITILYTKTND